MKKTIPGYGVAAAVLMAAAVAGFAACLSTGASTGSAQPNAGNQDQRKTPGSAGENAARVKTGRPKTEPAAPAKTDEELIAEAIDEGDCAALYAYIERGKDAADPKLLTIAGNALKRYTTLDTGTPKYRTGKMDPKVRRVPKELIEQVFVDPEAALPGVVASLAAGVSDSFLKAKILHDWICDNIAYDAAMYFSGRLGKQDYVSVLKKKLAVCSGYTNLYNEMCRLANIESIGINGYSKGFGYTGKIGRETDHAWNAVHIGNKWYLVDVTWDAGPMDRRTFIKRYSTEWLFLDGRPFLYSHLPDEDRYQFYAPVLSPEDFMREAYITGMFFQYGLSLKSEDPEYTNLIDQGFTFDLGLRNAALMLTSALRTAQQKEVPGAAWVERKGTSAVFDFDVPDTAEYTGHVFAGWNEVRPQQRVDIPAFEQSWLPGAEKLLEAKQISEAELELFKGAYFKVQDNNRYYFAEDQFDAPKNNAVLKVHKLLELSTGWLEDVLNFKVKAAPGYPGYGKDTLKYPHTFSTYNSVPNTQLISPLKGALQAGSTETFVVSSKDYNSIAIIIDGQFNFFTKNSKTGYHELTFEIPQAITTLKVSGGKDRRSTHWSLVQYEVVK
ncbi:MAG: hypothetical protein LBC51_02110 [Treponema sp.]|nr:hypothetical protein [Treponema sp.]